MSNAISLSADRLNTPQLLHASITTSTFTLPLVVFDVDAFARDFAVLVVHVVVRRLVVDAVLDFEVLLAPVFFAVDFAVAAAVARVLA